MVALEGVMETPEEVAVMRQLLERGWSRRRITTELGICRAAAPQARRTRVRAASIAGPPAPRLQRRGKWRQW